MSAARVLLIEDDPSIARFVELALEELPGHHPAAPAVELHTARTVAEAREALSRGGWRVVVSDLMLPDGSAEILLAEGFALAAGAPPWVVFSAGVHADRHLALATRGVARTLRKPVPLAELLDAVAELLTAAPRPAAAPTPVAADADPVQQHFAGDRALYDTFRQASIGHFADDLAQGDAAQAGSDAAALARVAHSLKAVLALIGEPRLAADAQVLELAASAWAPGAPWPTGWPELARGLIALGAQRRH